MKTYPTFKAMAIGCLLTLVLASAAGVGQPLTFTHFAGPIGGPGWVDGTGTSASFYLPVGVAADPSGNLYVGDYSNHSIRKITPAGVVTTPAGSPHYGFADGTGAEASFRNPYGLAVDGAGNVYVADTGNHSIRKVTPGGVVTTLAGTGSSGAVDGQGTSASFNLPYGVAVDAGGNIFVADGGNNKIRKITSGGMVTTLAGSGVVGSLDANGTGEHGRAGDGRGVQPSLRRGCRCLGRSLRRRHIQQQDLEDHAGRGGLYGGGLRKHRDP